MSYEDPTQNKNKTLRETLYDLFKDNQGTYPHHSEDLQLAEQINLIRSNLDKIVESQKGCNFKKISSTIKKSDECEDEKVVFLKTLYNFMEVQNQPILKPPKLGFQDLDLYKLYISVVKRGGMDKVTRKQEWKEVYMELGIPTMSTSASYNTRTNYKKYLYLYELEHEPQIHGYDENGQYERSERPTSSDSDHAESGNHFLFNVNQYIKIESKLHDGQVYYARILKRRMRDIIPSYYIMYNGWTIRFVFLKLKHSHNEWMPEYAIKSLSLEEQLGAAKLANPPAIRSSKSNYLIEEHLGLGANRPIPAASMPATPSLKLHLRLEPNTDHKNKSPQPMRRSPSPGRRKSPFSIEKVTRGDISIANILTSIGGDGRYIPIMTPPPTEDQQTQGCTRKQSNLHQKCSNHETALLRPITPPSSRVVEYTPAGLVSNAHNNISQQTPVFSLMYDSSSLGFNQPTQQKNTHLLSNDNIPQHDQQQYNLNRNENDKVQQENMSPTVTQVTPEISRRKRQIESLNSSLIHYNVSDSEIFKLEAQALHALPPSNGLKNPPPISKSNLSQLATLTLLSIAQLKNDSDAESNNTGYRDNHSNNINSFLPSKRIKVPNYKPQGGISVPEIKIASFSLQPPLEVKDKLEYLRRRLVEAKSRLKHHQLASYESETNYSSSFQRPGRKRAYKKASQKSPTPSVHSDKLAD